MWLFSDENWYFVDTYIFRIYWVQAMSTVTHVTWKIHSPTISLLNVTLLVMSQYYTKICRIAPILCNGKLQLSDGQRWKRNIVTRKVWHLDAMVLLQCQSHVKYSLRKCVTKCCWNGDRGQNHRSRKIENLHYCKIKYYHKKLVLRNKHLWNINPFSFRSS